MLFTITSHHKAFKAWKDGSELEFTNPDSTKILYKKAYQELQNDAAFLVRYGNFNEDKKHKTALVLFRKAKELANIPSLYSKTAKLYETQNDYKNAEKNLLKLHYISPHLFKPQEELLDFYIRTANQTKARWIAEKIIKTPIKIPSQEVKRIKQKAIKI